MYPYSYPYSSPLLADASLLPSPCFAVQVYLVVLSPFSIIRDMSCYEHLTSLASCHVPQTPFIAHMLEFIILFRAARLLSTKRCEFERYEDNCPLPIGIV